MKKIVIDARGDGGGHLNRALAIISRVYKYYQIDCIISTAFYPIIKNLLQIDNTTFHYRIIIDELKKIIFKADILIVDTFFSGINGEIMNIAKKEMIKIFIFRRLNYIETKLTENHLRNTNFYDLVISPTCDGINYSDLNGINHLKTGPLILTPYLWNRLKIVINIQLKKKIVKDAENKMKIHIIHIGQENEINFIRKESERLVNYLGENKILIRYFSPKNIIYPGFLAVMNADLIISGGGYNILAEAIKFNKRIISIPFQRKFDDQFARVLQYKQCYSNQVFISVEDYLNRYKSLNNNIVNHLLEAV